jgi:hypothetical protein
VPVTLSAFKPTKAATPTRCGSSNGGNVEGKIQYLEDLRAELSLALGEAIWAFAMIERQTYAYMRVLSSEPLHELMSGQSFRARTALIRKLIDRLQGQDENKVYALKYLEKAINLAHQRNTIAHNPWQIWIDFETSTFKTEIHKPIGDPTAIDLEAIRAFTNAAREAASGFEDALLHLKYPG